MYIQNISTEHTTCVESHAIVGSSRELQFWLKNSFHFLHFTIQESEIHKEFAGRLKSDVISNLDEQRKQLSISKRHWVNKIDILKRGLKEANDVFKKEHTKYNQMNLMTDDLKKKKSPLLSMMIPPYVLCNDEMTDNDRNSYIGRVWQCKSYFY